MPPKQKVKQKVSLKLSCQKLQPDGEKPIFNIGLHQIQRRVSGRSALQTLNNFLDQSNPKNKPRPPFTENTDFSEEKFKFSDTNTEAQNQMAGQFGAVFQCRHSDFPELQLAMKMIKIQTGIGPEAYRAFENIKRELDIIKQTNHPNIITWYGSYVEPKMNVVHILMEFADGPTIGRALQLSGRYPMYVLEYILKTCINALLYLKNTLKVAHRDLKPSNIIFCRNGCIKLLDFGMAKITKTNGIESIFVGARSYMSPEMLGDMNLSMDTDSNSKIDNHQSDMFSFATTLLECTFGFYPYPIVDEDELKQHLDTYKPATNRSSSQSENMANGSPGRTYLERSLEMSPFEVLEMLKELPNSSKFPDFCRDSANYFHPEYVDTVNGMCMRDPGDRTSYRELTEENAYFQSINVEQDAVGRWVEAIMQFV